MHRRSPLRILTLAAWSTLSLAACSGGGTEVPKVERQVITPCDGAITPTPGLPPATVAAFDVWQAIFAPPTVRFTATPVPTSRTQGPATPTPRPTPTPRDNILSVSVNTVDQGSATQYRLTVACQGTVVIPATFCGQSCAFPPPLADTDPCVGELSGARCPSASVDLNDFGFGDLRHVGCLIEIGPGQPLGFGECADPDRANYKLTVTLNNQAALSISLAAHNCRAPQSCLHDVFGIAIPDTPTPTPSAD